MIKKWFWLGILSFGLCIYLIWSIETIGPQGALQKTILANKDAVADILPPPLYIVESFLQINHYFQADSQEERNRLTLLIQKQREEFVQHKQFWESSQFFKDNSKIKNFEKVFASGEKTYQLFFKMVADLNAFNLNAHNLNVLNLKSEEANYKSNEVSQIFKKYKTDITLQFDLHRKDVAVLVAELKGQEVQLLEQSQLGLSQSRYIIFVLILFFLLLSFMFGTAKVERSFFNMEQLWLPLLVAVFSYWVYGQLGQKLILISTSIDDWRFLDLAFVGFITVIVARLMHSRHSLMTEKILASEQKYRELLQSYSNDVVIRLEAERKRISREIHDGIIQLLGSVKFRLESVKGKWRRDAKFSESEYDRSLDLLQTAITDLRRLCHELRPSLLDQVGLIGAIRSLIEDFEFRTNILVIADFEFEDEMLAEPERLELFRIFQELLTNCEKHSMATEVNMNLYSIAESLNIEISDNGQGIDLVNNNLPVHRGLGLINIQERIRSLNGVAEFFSSINKGFQVKIKIPLSKGCVKNEQHRTNSFDARR